MLTYVGRRILFSIPVLVIASFLLFGFVRATFDPTARLRSSRDPQTIQRAREELGLDKPLVIQYRDWATDFVQGDWGKSSRTQERVTAMIRRSLWATVQLIVWGVVISAIIAIAVGVYSAVLSVIILHFNLEGSRLISGAFSLLGIILSIVLAFRTNTAYERWWEGRKQWGMLVNNSRHAPGLTSTTGRGSVSGCGNGSRR